MNRNKISLGQLPELMQDLNEGTRKDQCDALRVLCPCRNRVYDRQIWIEIFRSMESKDPGVKHQAEHAIETLRQRALRDIKSWNLLMQLKQELSLPINNLFCDELSKVEPLYDQGWISSVLYQVKSGKEATVYCCQAAQSKVSNGSNGSKLLAAKIYRSNRGFSRKKWDTPAKHRLMKEKQGGSFFKEKKGNPRTDNSQFTPWVKNEFQTLQLLHDAGAEVPKPVAYTQSSLLMEWIGDYETPAPRLESVRLDRDEAQHLFELLIRDVELWLSLRKVHGDLSEFNILYWEGKAKVIDFSMATDPITSPNAYNLLFRDVGNLCRHFEKYGVKADPFDLVEKIWNRGFWRLQVAEELLNS